MKNKMIKAYCDITTAIDSFIHKERGAVDVVAIVILIAVAIGLAIIFRHQLEDLLSQWFGSIGDKGSQAINN